MNKENILYYSSKCNMSKQLIGLMTQEKMINFFKCICIDNTPLVKTVITPTIILKNNDITYIGNNTFNWYSMMIQEKKKAIMHKLNEERIEIFNSMNKNLVSNNVPDDLKNMHNYDQNTMESTNDIYTNCKDTENKSYNQNYYKIEQFSKKGDLALYFNVHKDDTKKISDEEAYKILTDKQNERNELISAIKGSTQTYLNKNGIKS